MLARLLRKLILPVEIFCNTFQSYEVLFLSEKADWSIYQDGLNLQKYLRRRGVRLRIAHTLTGARGRIVHFGSISTFVSHESHPALHRNRLLASWFHVNDEATVSSIVASLLAHKVRVHTSCQITKVRLLEAGLPEAKICVLPVAIDLETFSPIQESKEVLKSELDLPKNKIVIGSFQKDGNGWGEGTEPKLVKGPDLFCDTLKLLGDPGRFHVLLTGPSRGYVKGRLKELGISFSHHYLKRPGDLRRYYACLDFYLMTSRAEGGPKALSECWAMNVPLIATPVGMVPDWSTDGVDTLVAKAIRAPELKAEVDRYLSDPSFGPRLAAAGQEKVQRLGVDAQAQAYLDLYRSL